MEKGSKPHLFRERLIPRKDHADEIKNFFFWTTKWGTVELASSIPMDLG